MTRRQSRALRRRFSPKLESLESRQMFAVYYIDSIHGDNDHSGETPDAAFKTVENLVSRYAAPDQPAGYRPLQPGDEIVFMPGTHDFIYTYSTEGGTQFQSLFLRNVHGTQEQPIVIRGMEGANLRARAPDGSELSPIEILSSSHIQIEGLDISSYGSGVFIADSSDVTVQSNVIHDVDGISNNNVSGVYVVGSHDTLIQENEFKDNFDRSNPGSENNGILWCSVVPIPRSCAISSTKRLWVPKWSCL